MYISLNQWKKLIYKIMEVSQYSYIILDLSENVQELFELLKICNKVYTIVKDDLIAQCKINQYEQLLHIYQCEEVIDKTNKCKLPLFSKIPSDIEYYTKGDLADYIENVIRNDLEDCYV